jgi:hypothetical protein
LVAIFFGFRNIGFRHRHRTNINAKVMQKLIVGILAYFIIQAAATAVASESLWIEAEHLEGVRGYCWPMGRPNMKQTAGHWALSGPGWAAEWNQGGESGFLSIATGADDDKAVATKTIDVPVDGRYAVWVRYGDWREKTERFQIAIEQAGGKPWIGRFGEQAVVEEDNEAKLYWGWAFAWSKQEVELKKGPAKLSHAWSAATCRRFHFHSTCAGESHRLRKKAATSCRTPKATCICFHRNQACFYEKRACCAAIEPSRQQRAPAR